MKNLRKWTAWLGAGAVVMTLSAGCADRNQNGQPDSVATSEETANAVKEGVDKTENAADKAGAAISEGAKDAGSAIAKTTDKVGAEVADGAKKTADVVTGAGAALTQTPTIKNALGAAEALKGSEINVDTIAATKTVVLRGSVKTASQKNLAGSIAKRNSDGFKIDNQLKVVS